MSSLFRDESLDGTITYNDVDRTSFIIVDSGTSWHNGLADKIVDEIFPISMPYYPPIENYKVYGQDFLTDTKNGDFDTIALFNVVTPDAEDIVIGKYYKNSDDGFTEISKEEFDDRVKMHYDRLENQLN